MLMRSWITTFTGARVDPLDLMAFDVRIEDIAHSLACINRFGGHIRRPISVAQHSVYVSRLCPPELALQGLLHDASEYVLGDVTKWLKNTPTFALYRQAEERAQKTIFQKFGCEEDMAPEVEAADKLMVRFEAMRSGLRIDHPDYPAISKEEKERIGPWQYWGWKMAEEVFLAEFRCLQFGK